MNIWILSCELTNFSPKVREDYLKKAGEIDSNNLHAKYSLIATYERMKAGHIDGVQKIIKQRFVSYFICSTP